MDFISTSQDIFYLVLSFCVLWLTIFLAWLMYYGIMAIKQVYEMVRNIKAKIDAVDELIALIKDKLVSSTSYLSLIVGGVRKMIEVLGERESKKRRAKK